MRPQVPCYGFVKNLWTDDQEAVTSNELGQDYLRDLVKEQTRPRTSIRSYPSLLMQSVRALDTRC